MKNNTKIALAVAGVIFLQSIGGGLAYADSPSGTVMYNGQAVQVTNGQFTLNGVSGTIDSQGNYSWNGTSANILNTPGVTGYQISGQAAVPVTPVAAPTPVAPAPVAVKGPTGTVMYNGQSVQVTNGQFSLNGKTGTIDDKGNYVYDGQTGNILTTAGVSSYQIQGQTAVPVDTSTHRVVSGKDRNGNYSNVDIDFLAQSMKDGTFNVNNFFVKGYAQALKFSDAEIADFQSFVNSHTAKEIADKIASLPTDTIMKIDEMRPTSSVGIAWRVDPWYLSRFLMSTPESWQNVLEYAGIPFTQADLDRLHNGTQADMVSWLSTLSNDKFEKVQAYAYNASDITGKPYFATGWDDKSSYDPEIGRVVTPAEKDAIARIKFYTVNMYFTLRGGNGGLTATGSGKVIPNTNGLWKPDAFKEYLTDAAIADFVAHPDKGTFAGGTGGNITFGDGTRTAGGSIGTQTVSTTSSPVTPTTDNTLTNASNPNASYINPYASSFSAANLSTLGTWINTKIRAKQSTMTAANYSTFINTLATKITSLKSSMTDQTKITILNYILYEVTTIQSGLSDSSGSSTSFLDQLIN